MKKALFVAAALVALPSMGHTGIRTAARLLHRRQRRRGLVPHQHDDGQRIVQQHDRSLADVVAGTTSSARASNSSRLRSSPSPPILPNCHGIEFRRRSPPAPVMGKALSTSSSVDHHAYIGAGAGVAFVEATTPSCRTRCSRYRASSAWATTSTAVARPPRRRYVGTTNANVVINGVKCGSTTPTSSRCNDGTSSPRRSATAPPAPAAAYDTAFLHHVLRLGWFKTSPCRRLRSTSSPPPPPTSRAAPRPSFSHTDTSTASTWRSRCGVDAAGRARPRTCRTNIAINRTSEQGLLVRPPTACASHRTVASKSWSSRPQPDCAQVAAQSRTLTASATN